jgi:uncharacterized protein (DUF1501 family)
VPGLSRRAQQRAMAAYRELAAPRRDDRTGRAAVRSQARLAHAVSEALGALDGAHGVIDPVALGYPSGSPTGARLSQLAHILAQPLGTRLATVDCSGDFDTHNNQPGRLSDELADVSASLSAFQADLDARGLSDRVLTFVWTEFGRRLRGNRSIGTDHGAGGIAWLMGSHAASGVLTEYPALDNLDDKGNLKVTVDFREVYASLIEQWLGTSAEPIIPDARTMGRIQIVK